MLSRYYLCVAVALSCLLTGCATAVVPSNEYLLMDHDGEATTSMSSDSFSKKQPDKKQQVVQIQLLPIRVADYLAGNEMVLVSKQGEVFRSQQNLWAEPLGPQLSRLTLQALIKRMPNIEWFGPQDLVSSSERLSIDVDSFYGDLNGEVHVAGRWRLISSSGQILISKEFVAQGRLPKSGYPALVQTLGKVWFQKVIDPMVKTLEVAD
ncbi:PqiC family protein [Marinomonas spartinae]|uniref:PqiC family protein n=1 Tax=Marinomonas spartinae TaxID=1792290 RepID=UPI0018F1D4A6|nr:ABC-type transport auxiliary lipoprotein family protein [Marinomonas spartinae]MBJ7553633.1 membrane integrity-associated transporter subunit PqiC [Marinomonas spartinae]